MKNTKNLSKSAIRYSLILLITLLHQSLTLNAQVEESYKKNSFYLSYGNIIFADQFSISYERLLFQKDKKRTKLKANYGSYLNNNWDFDTGAIVYKNYGSLSAVQLIGMLELNAGVAFAQYTLDPGFDPVPGTDYSIVKNRITFYGNIGVRYVKDRFLFRAGLGNLELLYIGVGFNL